MDEYETKFGLEKEYLHNWQPPCSCGISIERIDLEKQDKYKHREQNYNPLKKENLHNWIPPCSCGISIERIDLEKRVKK